jgi:hypothetical protein
MALSVLKWVIVSFMILMFIIFIKQTLDPSTQKASGINLNYIYGILLVLVSILFMCIMFFKSLNQYKIIIWLMGLIFTFFAVVYLIQAKVNGSALFTVGLVCGIIALFSIYGFTDNFEHALQWMSAHKSIIGITFIVGLVLYAKTLKPSTTTKYARPFVGILSFDILILFLNVLMSSLLFTDTNIGLSVYLPAYMSAYMLGTDKSGDHIDGGTAHIIESTKSHDVRPTISIIITFLLFCYAGLYVIFPNKEEITNFISHNMNVLYILLTISGVLLFYKIFPENVIKKGSIAILPLQLLLFMWLFYRALQSKGDNIQYERIKYLLIFFCFVSTIGILYSTNSVSNNLSNYSQLFTFLLVFLSLGFIFLLFNLNISSINIVKDFYGIKYYNKCSHTENFSLPYDGALFSTILSIFLFIGFLFIVGGKIFFYPGGFLMDSKKTPEIIFMLLIITILWILFFTIQLFPNILSEPETPLDLLNKSKQSKTFVIILGMLLAFMFFNWVFTTLHNLSNTSTFIYACFNLLFIVFIVVLVYKFINPPGSKEVDSKISTLGTSIKTQSTNMMGILTNSLSKNPIITSIIVVVSILTCILIYYNLPKVIHRLASSASSEKHLTTDSININSATILATYEELNDTNDVFNYSYGISYWVYIDSLPPHYNKYASVLNYGNKPNMLYNPASNTFIVSIEKALLKNNNTVNELHNLDDDGNIIIYKKTNFPLQKWHHIVVNYTDGLLDIFLNGTLVKSTKYFIPYMKLDNLTIGEKQGVNGKIRDVIYYTSPLTTQQINNNYNNL